MGLEVAGLHAGGFPRVCVFHLHSEGVALLLGALEINPVCPRGHMRKAVLSAYTASQKVASSELLPLGPKALEEGRLVLYSLQDKWGKQGRCDCLPSACASVFLSDADMLQPAGWQVV